MKTITKTITLAILLATSLSSHASTWKGADGNWNSNSSTGWNGTGIPNSIGATAIFEATAAARTTTQNISAGVTIGTLSFTGISIAGSRSITLTNPITFNQDGAGAGTALIENTNTSASASNFLRIGSTTSQTITLADDLRISNATGSSGYISILAAIGGAGNITFSNLNTAISSVGAISLGSAANTFTGTVLIQKGTVMSASKSKQFGVITNNVTLGQSGQGSAAFLMSASSSNLQNNITIAAGTGGVSTLGKTGSGEGTYSGEITLNGNINIYSEVSNTKGLDFTNVISGSGSITHDPGTAATATGIIKLSAANTYTGLTNLGSPLKGTGSTLLLANTLALQNSTLNYFGTSKLAFASTVATKAFTFGGLTGSSNITLQDDAGTPTAITLSVGNNNSNTTYSGKLTGAGNLIKTGTGTLSLTGDNTYTGTTTINAGTLIVGTSGTGSIASDVTVNNGTLGGSGIITGNVTINNGGNLAPGNSPGLLTIANDLDLMTDSTFTWELSSQTTSGRGTNFDAVDVGGELNVSNAFFKIVITGLDLNSSFWETTQSWQVFNKGLNSGLGFQEFQLFSSIDLNNPVSYSSYGNFTFDGGTGALQWNVIPEPSTAILLVLGMGVLLTKRQRKHNSIENSPKKI